jgi:transketolase
MIPFEDYKRLLGSSAQDMKDEEIEQAKAVADMPTLILANTIPGKGKEIEGDYKWHGKPPTPEEGERFIKEILSI